MDVCLRIGESGAVFGRCSAVDFQKADAGGVSIFSRIGFELIFDMCHDSTACVGRSFGAGVGMQGESSSGLIRLQICTNKKTRLWGLRFQRGRSALDRRATEETAVVLAHASSTVAMTAANATQGVTRDKLGGRVCGAIHMGSRSMQEKTGGGTDADDVRVGGGSALKIGENDGCDRGGAVFQTGDDRLTQAHMKASNSRWQNSTE